VPGPHPHHRLDPLGHVAVLDPPQEDQDEEARGELIRGEDESELPAAEREGRRAERVDGGPRALRAVGLREFPSLDEQA